MCIILGLVLIVLSLIGIYFEEEDKKYAKEEEKAEEDDGEEQDEEAKKAAEEEKKKKEAEEEEDDDEKKTMSLGEFCTLIGVLFKNASTFQKINFFMIMLVCMGQFIKYGYDSYAMAWA